MPFTRLRKAERCSARRRLKVTWGPAPTADEIRARDQERFLAEPIFTDAATEEELALARTLNSAHTAEGDRALLSFGLHRDRLPAPELEGFLGPPRLRGQVRRQPEERFDRGPDREERDRTAIDSGIRGRNRAGSIPKNARLGKTRAKWFGSASISGVTATPSRAGCCR